jgi:hypothetical protein
MRQSYGLRHGVGGPPLRLAGRSTPTHRYRFRRFLGADRRGNAPGRSRTCRRHTPRSWERRASPLWHGRHRTGGRKGQPGRVRNTAWARCAWRTVLPGNGAMECRTLRRTFCAAVISIAPAKSGGAAQLMPPMSVNIGRERYRRHDRHHPYNRALRHARASLQLSQGPS